MQESGTHQLGLYVAVITGYAVYTTSMISPKSAFSRLHLR